MKYIALIRGINFGGNKKVPMLKLKEIFESLGFTDVKTYLNSGNVTFIDNSKNIENITEIIENKLFKEFKFQIQVLVKDLNSLLKIYQKIPSSWNEGKNKGVHIAFLWREIDHESIIENLKKDQILYVPGAILWNVDLKHWSKDTVYKFTNGKMSKYITVRSANTIRKILI